MSLPVITAVVLAGSPVDAAAPAGSARLISDAAAQQKYAFVLFYRRDDPATQVMEQTVRASLARHSKQTALLKVRVTDPAERQIVSRYDATRTPLPAVMALAPNGAVTGVFPLRVQAQQVEQAILTPKYSDMVKALQDRKIVLLCMQPGGGEAGVPRGVVDFEADAAFKGRTHRVVVAAAEAGEERFFARMNVDRNLRSPVVVLFAPPGSFLGKFDASVFQRRARIDRAQVGQVQLRKMPRTGPVVAWPYFSSSKIRPFQTSAATR